MIFEGKEGQYNRYEDNDYGGDEKPYFTTAVPAATDRRHVY